MAKVMKMRNFTGKKKVFFTISIILVACSLLLTVFGVELAIEFKGGTIVTYGYEGDMDPNSAKSDIESIVNTTINIQQGDSMNSDSKTITISFSSNEGLSAEKQGELTTKLQEKFEGNKIELLDSNDVSPSSGKEFFLKCLVAVLFAALLLILYIAFQFKKISGWSSGVFAIIALLHDVIITYGFFIACRFEINANFMAVVLTIFGCSINNTIVVYDRIRENRKLMGRVTMNELVNTSINQSLTRSIRTSVSTVSSMVIICVVSYVCGVTSILSFAFPMIIGMAIGTYSSLFLAPTLWLAWQQRGGNAQKRA